MSSSDFVSLKHTRTIIKWRSRRCINVERERWGRRLITNVNQVIRLELWLQKWHEEAFVGNESESARANRTYSTYSREPNLLCIDGGVGEPNTLLPVHSRKTVHEVWNAWNSRWNITWRWFVAWSRELDGVGVTESTGACRQDAHWSVMYHGSMWRSLPLDIQL